MTTNLVTEIRDAYELIQKGEFQNALDRVKLLVDTNSSNLDLLKLKAYCLSKLGRQKSAIDTLLLAKSLNPKDVDILNNLGNAYQSLGQLEDARICFETAIELNPESSIALYNLSLVYKVSHDYDAAINSLLLSAHYNPNFKQALNELGVCYIFIGNKSEAIKWLRASLALDPDYPEALNNLGVVLSSIDESDEAIKVISKAISLNPNLQNAYINLGNAFMGNAQIIESKKAYEKALSLDPNDHIALWQLHSTANTIFEALEILQKCTLCPSAEDKAIKMYRGLLNIDTEHRHAQNDTVTRATDHPYDRSFNWYLNLKYKPKVFFNRWALFDFAVSQSNQARPFYEFGVWKAKAFKYLMKTYEFGFGFDTFTGLPEPWHNEETGTYSSDGNVPNISNAEFIVGEFQVTLPEFFQTKRPKASLINFDADLYSSTICALENCKSIIDENTVLIFDEFIMNEYWEQDEFKALEEFCASHNLTYRVIGVSFYTKQVVVKLKSSGNLS